MQAISYNFLKPGYAEGMAAGRPAKQARTTFGERLASAREGAGLTQLQLAEKLGTSQRVITYWEREPVALRAEQLAALADVLGVTTDFLVGRDAAKPRGQGPAGKLRQVFDQASQLPRHQQGKVIEFLENYLRGKASGAT
jgi:transcriptional regulator with XRE-family HTH domain